MTPLHIAIIGGFNLQAAWTMEYVVGQHIGEERKNAE